MLGSSAGSFGGVGKIANLGLNTIMDMERIENTTLATSNATSTVLVLQTDFFIMFCFFMSLLFLGHNCLWAHSTKKPEAMVNSELKAVAKWKKGKGDDAIPSKKPLLMQRHSETMERMDQTLAQQHLEENGLQCQPGWLHALSNESRKSRLAQVLDHTNDKRMQHNMCDVHTQPRPHEARGGGKILRRRTKIIRSGTCVLAPVKDCGTKIFSQSNKSEISPNTSEISPIQAVIHSLIVL
jgi:hypothetical protein